MLAAKIAKIVRKCEAKQATQIKRLRKEPVENLETKNQKLQ